MGGHRLMNRPRVLLLGGGGFLGGHIAEALLEGGSPVRVFDRAPGSRLSQLAADIEFCLGDFDNRSDLSSALDGCPLIIHLVSTTIPKTSNEDPVADLKDNLIGTVRFLEFARRARVRKIIFASSGGTVYGVPTIVPIPEDHATRPVCSYGIHKLAIEQYMELYRRLHELDYCVLRMSNPYGEHQRADSGQGAVAVFLDHVIRGHEIEIWGDGSAVRDYVYVKDVAQAFYRATMYAGEPRTFNIGSGQGTTVTELLQLIEQVTRRPIRRRHLPARPFDVPTNVLDISRARNYLGWQPLHSLEQGLRRTLSWFESTIESATPAPPRIRGLV
jgi:UDP-glucose 4-epimerase